MAKKSKIARNEQRREVIERFAARRAELKELIRKPSTGDAERLAAVGAAGVADLPAFPGCEGFAGPIVQTISGPSWSRLAFAPTCSTLPRQLAPRK